MPFDFSAPVLFDGAFGTYYYELTRSSSLAECACLERPDVVRRIHREYLSAGARVVRTNTFAANLAEFPEREKLSRVLEAALSLATECAEPYGAEVFASVGCVADKELAAESYLTVCRMFADLGTKNFLFETLDSLEGVEDAVDFLRREVPGAVVGISVAAGQDGTTARGLSAEHLLEQARKLADFAGFNCRMGPAHLSGLLSRLPESTVPLLALPNAGYPSSVGGRVVFENNPEYFAAKTAELLGFGAVLLGGCCGTTPRHVACLAEELSSHKARASSFVQKERAPVRIVGKKPRLVGRGKKYVAVELDPPVDADLSFFLSASRAVLSAGADAVTVSDSPFGKTRADALLCSLKLLSEGAPTVIPHITCRDKNRVALKGGLLAANAAGIDRVFLVTGDPPLKENATRGGGVFSFNSFELIRFVNTLNEEVFTQRPFSVGAALNVNAPNFEKELSRAQKKEECGADFFLTQPVFSEEAAENLKRARNVLKCGLLCGIMPVAGYKNARFLQNEVAGMGVPQRLVDALEGKEPEEARAIALAEAERTVDRLYDFCDGFFLMLPLKKVDYVTHLAEYIQKKAPSPAATS